MDDNIEVQETSENPAEVETTEETVSEPAEAPEKTEVRNEPQVIARMKKAEADNKRLREIVRKDILGEEGQVEQKSAPEEEQDLLGQVADNLALIRDLKSDEIDALRSEASTLGIPKKDQGKFIQSKAGKAFLGSFRKEQEVARTTPSPSTKGVAPGKEAAPEKKSSFPTVDEWKASKQKQRDNE